MFIGCGVLRGRGTIGSSECYSRQYEMIRCKVWKREELDAIERISRIEKAQNLVVTGWRVLDLLNLQPTAFLRRTSANSNSAFTAYRSSDPSQDRASSPLTADIPGIVPGTAVPMSWLQLVVSKVKLLYFVIDV